jgi:type I restriction enzyme R subunit
VNQFTESTVEDAALAWLRGQGYSLLHGPEIAQGEPDSERASFGDVFLMDRLRSAIACINPKLPADAVDEVVRRVTRTEAPSLIEINRRLHRLLIDGVDVSFATKAGLKHDKAWLVDFDHPDRNEFLAINQFTVIEGKANRRPDIVLFINGLPVAVIELKNAAYENATIRGAYNQIQTYKKDIPSLFTANALLLISVGLAAHVGTLAAYQKSRAPRLPVGDIKSPQRGRASGSHGP